MLSRLFIPGEERNMYDNSAPDILHPVARESNAKKLSRCCQNNGMICDEINIWNSKVNKIANHIVRIVIAGYVSWQLRATYNQILFIFDNNKWSCGILLRKVNCLHRSQETYLQRINLQNKRNMLIAMIMEKRRKLCTTMVWVGSCGIKPIKSSITVCSCLVETRHRFVSIVYLLRGYQYGYWLPIYVMALL